MVLYSLYSLANSSTVQRVAKQLSFLLLFPTSVNWPYLERERGNVVSFLRSCRLVGPQSAAPLSPPSTLLYHQGEKEASPVGWGKGWMDGWMEVRRKEMLCSPNPA